MSKPTGRPIGRPFKGPRDALMIRPHALVGQEIRRRAVEAGMPYTDYVSQLLAEHVGHPELAPKPHPELPMTG